MMYTDREELIYKAELGVIIGCAIEVHNSLGFGFRILPCQQQKQFDWDTSSTLNSICWNEAGSDDKNISGNRCHQWFKLLSLKRNSDKGRTTTDFTDEH
jgi:hypothetical protein